MQRFWFGFARHFDTNNDTFIDKNEFFAMLDTLDINLSEEEKNDMVINYSGEITACTMCTDTFLSLRKQILIRTNCYRPKNSSI
jgi:Ca2+-binding EF-hand superfamily protein